MVTSISWDEGENASTPQWYIYTIFSTVKNSGQKKCKNNYGLYNE